MKLQTQMSPHTLNTPFTEANTITYALTHSDNSPEGTLCTKANYSFSGIDSNNYYANVDEFEGNAAAVAKHF